MEFRLVLLPAVAVLCFLAVLSNGQDAAGPSVDDICIGCICEAASGCNRTVGCTNGMCGLFKITWPYWADAGKFVIEGDTADAPDAWIRCVTDPFCASQTVQSYLGKFKKDCDGDGDVDCQDMASIHHLGGYGCGSRPLDPKYQNGFTTCLTQVGALQG